MMNGLGSHIEFAQIQAANFQAQSAKDVAHESAREAVRLRKDVERLYMVVQAVWELVKERTDLEDKDLAERIREVDLRDGREDGKDATQTAVSVCVRCGRTLEKGSSLCLWCGATSNAGAFNHIGS